MLFETGYKDCSWQLPSEKKEWYHNMGVMVTYQSSHAAMAQTMKYVANNCYAV